MLLVLAGTAAACSHRRLALSEPPDGGGGIDAVVDEHTTDVGTADDAAAAADAAGDAAPRVPRNHRAAGQACPRDRGPSTLTPDYVAQCVSGLGSATLVACMSDADCTTGADGECTAFHGPIACVIGCSYDECFDDTGCPSPAPCECRVSADSPDANHCETNSTCQVDDDCGPGGFCSPSELDQFCFCPSTALCTPDDHCYAGTMEVPCACGDACGHGYFCHTKDDTCIDDEDCAGGTCSFDTVTRNWHCVSCWPIP
jgi:hypothetical protein